MVRLPNQLRVSIPVDQLEEFCKRWRIVRLEVFGSSLHDDFDADSDVDFLYTLDLDATWGLEFMDAYDELSANPIRRRAILESAQLLYAA